MSLRPIADLFEEIPLKVREEFARAIALPGSQAIILGEDNESDGPPVSIAEAVALRRAFTVQLALHNLAIDQDDVEQANALEVFEAEAIARRLRPVVVESGRPGHQHLIVAVYDGRVRIELMNRARELGLRLTASLRPPLSPHRLGFAPRILRPDSVDKALDALRPRGQRDLPARMERVLRDGDLEGRYRKDDGTIDRSSMLAALTTSFVDRGWSRDQAYPRLTDPVNRGGAKLHAIKRERGQQAARHYFRELWKQQVTFVREHPPINDVPSEVIARLDSILATAALALPWSMRGHSLWALLAALVAVSYDAGSDLAFEASRRQLAERAGLSWRTTRKGLAELLEAGWLERIRRGIGTRGTHWRFRAPGVAVAADPSIPGRFAPLGGALRLLGSLVAPGHDALRWRAAGRAGLGKAAHRLLLILAVRGPTSATALVHLTSAKWSQIRRLRRKLAQHGVLEDGETLRVPPDVHLRIEQLARSLGTAGAADRQKRDHQREREDYRQAWDRRTAAYCAARRRRGKEQDPVSPRAPSGPEASA